MRRDLGPGSSLGVVFFADAMEELEATHIPQSIPATGAPAMSARLAFGALFIQQPLDLSDEEIVEQMRENTSMPFILGFVGLFHLGTV